jgi:hypothetical protein
MGCIIGALTPMPWTRVILFGIGFGVVINIISALYNHLENKEAEK